MYGSEFSLVTPLEAFGSGCVLKSPSQCNDRAYASHGESHRLHEHLLTRNERLDMVCSSSPANGTKGK